MEKNNIWWGFSTKRARERARERERESVCVCVYMWLCQGWQTSWGRPVADKASRQKTVYTLKQTPTELNTVHTSLLKWKWPELWWALCVHEKRRTKEKKRVWETVSKTEVCWFKSTTFSLFLHVFCLVSFSCKWVKCICVAPFTQSTLQVHYKRCKKKQKWPPKPCIQ